METRPAKRIKLPPKLDPFRFIPRVELADPGLSIDRFPPEVKLQLLSILHPSSLRHLTLASAAYYRLYATRRITLIMGALYRELGRGIHDALILEQALEWRSDPDAYVEWEANPFLRDLYIPVHPEALRYSPVNHPRRLVSHQRQALRMFATYLNIIKPIRESMLEHYADLLPVLSLYGRQPRQLEIFRITRALYRYELCCALYGEYKPAGDTKRVNWSRYTVVAQLYTMFEPWEIEEISCVFDFITSRYCSIFNQIKWCPILPRLDNPANKRRHWWKKPLPTENWEINSAYEPRLHVVRAIASAGLSMYKALHKTSSSTPDDLLNAVKMACPRRVPRFLADDDTLSEIIQVHVRRDLREQGLMGYDYEEKWPEVETLAGPPPAWEAVWEGDFSARVGAHNPHVAREWGYVFWNESRFHIGVHLQMMEDWHEDGRVAEQRESNRLELEGHWDPTYDVQIWPHEDRPRPLERWYWEERNEE